MEIAEASGQPDPDPSARRRDILRAITSFVQRYGFAPTYREIANVTGLASTSSVAYHVKILKAQGKVSRSGKRPRTVVAIAPAEPAPAPGDGAAGDGAAGGSAAGDGAAGGSAVGDGAAGGSAVGDGAAGDGAAGGSASGDGTAPGAYHRPKAVRVPLTDGRIAAGRPILAEGSVEDVLFLPSQLVGDGDLFMLKVAGDSMINAAITDGDMVVVRRNTDVENGDIVAAMIEDFEQEATVKTLKRADGHVWLLPQNPAYEPIPGDKAEILGRVVAVLRRL